MEKNRSYVLDKETKGSVRYADEDKTSPFGPVYVRKDGLPTPMPKAMRVSFDFGPTDGES